MEILSVSLKSLVASFAMLGNSYLLPVVSATRHARLAQLAHTHQVQAHRRARRVNKASISKSLVKSHVKLALLEHI